ncbi:hypothetical protein CE143_01495 [Photorhabdus luminescens]|uniref:Uncharacterized protein n=1 Tax=Photorhabdus akhurstii TaxID=171438 RepID=A0ABX8LNF8_9GAMM|nr:MULTISPECIES: hypothetical protein [Photorhabdus]MCC8460318.1 hypothetical protein [Photorhabdus aegyptia]PQQ40851.1 hypothetical protein C6H65_12840 [Photorhabdus luminescens]QXF31996.1 hypothetical protein B0X70_01495 [Photorhabdus akhurstii]UJD73789.1 hypothetical protein CE143_01495 [Photorhabdus luminescens]
MTQKKTCIPFHFNAGTINVPHDWRDVSMLVFTSPDDHNGSSFTLPWASTSPSLPNAKSLHSVSS